MNTIRLLFFATLRDLTGSRRATLDIEHGARVGELKVALIAAYPKLHRALGTAIFSVNGEYREDDGEIPDGAEVAIFPPVSGG